MLKLKSHFVFFKEQRNGIFLLLILIIVFQCIYFFTDFTSEDIPTNNPEISKFIKKVDSLKLLELEARKPKRYPFNPNFITDYKGATLGMTTKEIDRLLLYRNKGQWVNSSRQFQEVTKVSDSLLAVMSPFFKFPKRIIYDKPKTYAKYAGTNRLLSYAQKQDLNSATALQLQKVKGVGKVFSNRIIKYRNKLKGGFIADVQLLDVYGLSPETILKIKEQFTVKTPGTVNKINLNTATIDDLVTIPNIDYDLAHNIIEFRHLVEGFKTINELTKVKDFPVNKIEIIKLYLFSQKEK